MWFGDCLHYNLYNLTVLQNCQDRWKWGLHGIFLSFLDVFGPLIPNLDDAKSYLLSILRFGWKKSIFGKKLFFFFYIFNKVEAGFLFVIGWSWFYRSFCILRFGCKKSIFGKNLFFFFFFFTYLRGYCTSGPYFWRLCAFSQKIKQLRTKYPMDLVRSVPRNSKITILLQ